MRTRAVMRGRGLELPGWDDDVGLQINVFWSEMLRREEQLAASQQRFNTFMTYVMSGLPGNVELEPRAKALEPLMDDLLSKVDHSAYTLEKKVVAAIERRNKARDKISEIEHMKWISGDEFSLRDWFNFEDPAYGK